VSCSQNSPLKGPHPKKVIPKADKTLGETTAPKKGKHPGKLGFCPRRKVQRKDRETPPKRPNPNGASLPKQFKSPSLSSTKPPF